jgi:hypothetical protein
MARQPDVRRAGAVVAVSRGGLQTELSLLVEPGASMQRVIRNANDTVARVYREEVGATSIARPRLRIAYDEASLNPTVEAPARDYPTTEPSRQTAFIYAYAAGVPAPSEPTIGQPASPAPAGARPKLPPPPSPTRRPFGQPPASTPPMPGNGRTAPNHGARPHPGVAWPEDDPAPGRGEAHDPA